MTSRMIKDPMKVYSAGDKCTHQIDWKHRTKQNELCFLTNKEGSDLNLEGSEKTYLHLHLYLSLFLCLVVALEEGLGRAQCHSIHHWNSMG